MSSEFEPSTASVNTPHNAAEAHVDNIATGLGGVRGFPFLFFYTA